LIQRVIGRRASALAASLVPWTNFFGVDWHVNWYNTTRRYWMIDNFSQISFKLALQEIALAE
jgi:hypothetical protein